MFFTPDINKVSAKEKAEELFAESPGLKNHPSPEIKLKTDRELNELIIMACCESPYNSDIEKEWWKKVLIEYRKLQNSLL